jgi:hypothetical protein
LRRLASSQGLLGLSQPGDVLNRDGAARHFPLFVPNRDGAVVHVAMAAVEALDLKDLPEDRRALAHRPGRGPFVGQDRAAGVRPPGPVLLVVLDAAGDGARPPNVLVALIGEHHAALGVGDDHTDRQCLQDGLHIALPFFRLPAGRVHRRLGHLAVGDVLLAQPRFAPPPLGHVLDGQEYQFGPRQAEPTGVEQHDLRPDIREDVLDLKVVDGQVLGEDLLEQGAQAGDVPLAVAEVVQAPARGVRRRDPKGAVEGTVGTLHPQARVEQQQRLAHGVVDALDVGQGVAARFPVRRSLISRHVVHRECWPSSASGPPDAGPRASETRQPPPTPVSYPRHLTTSRDSGAFDGWYIAAAVGAAPRMTAVMSRARCGARIGS